ncbi:MAG TPA: hypothetical protein VIV61_15110 [Candidatus Ozemobacteraceae bacterium]
MAASKTGSGLRSCLSCLGCGCIFPAIFIVGLVIAAIFLLPQFTEPPATSAIPRPPEITREDRWSLQDKLTAAMQEAGSGPLRLDLTLPEFNALLGRADPRPAAGFALTHAWAYSAADRLQFVLEGSGFWQRRLTLEIDLANPTAPQRLSGIRFNEHAVPDRLVRLIGPRWIERWLADGLGINIRPNTPTSCDIAIASDVVILTGVFPRLGIPAQGAGQ